MAVPAEPKAEPPDQRPDDGRDAERAPGERIQMTVSRRDPDALAIALRGWLADQLGALPELSGARMPSSGGLSSTSLLLEATWLSKWQPPNGAWVARIAPEDNPMPVYP